MNSTRQFPSLLWRKEAGTRKSHRRSRIGVGKLSTLAGIMCYDAADSCGADLVEAGGGYVHGEAHEMVGMGR